ncbi:MAG: putative ATP-dependent helicase/nuclease, partial [Actinomycetota bacterium]
ATFVEAYLRNMRDSRPGQVDPTELLQRATELLTESPTAVRQTLVVDDAHDLTPSQWRFVTTWAEWRGPVVVLGDPKLATTGFRGGSAAFLRDGATPIDWAAPVTLTTFHRQSGAVMTILRSVAEAIGGPEVTIQKSYPAALAPTAARSAGGTRLSSATAASPAHEREVIARFVRDAVVDGTPLDRIAVIVRSGALAESIVTSLSASSIPAYAETTGSPLRDHPAVWSLLQLINIGTGREAVTVDIVRDLLLGPFGRMTTLDYRRFRRNLRKAEITAGGNRLADELVLEVFTSPGAFETEVGFSAPGVRWVIDALRAVAGATGWQIDELLWLVWNRSNRASVWAEESTGSGPVAVKAHESLDAVMALFDVAASSLENVPSESADVLLDRMLDQTVPNDSLSPRATAGAVLVCTPAAVVGREFDVTVIAGLNDGVWPNTRARSALLKAHELTLVHEGIDLADLDLRKEVLFDELRLFLVAASRASERVLVTAISSEDETPSALFRLVAGEKGDDEKTPRSVPAENALGDVFVSERIDSNIGEMVGRLRHVLVADGERIDGGERRYSADDKARAAAALRELAARGVAGASPDEWLGFRPIERTILFRNGTVFVSPSQIEKFEKSHLDWFVDNVAGGSSGIAATIGNLVHWAIEKSETGDKADMLARATERFDEISFEAPVEKERWRAIMHTLVDGLADYVTKAAAQGRALAPNGAEVTARYVIPGDVAGPLDIHISAKIDRIERKDGSGFVIVDIKTGTQLAVVKDMQNNRQLQAYQLVFTSGVFDEKSGFALTPDERTLVGAELIYPREGTKDAKFKERKQAPLTPHDLADFEKLIVDLVALMRQDVLDGNREPERIGGDIPLDALWVRIPEVSADV